MANEKQKEFWSGVGGQHWVEKNETLDEMLVPFGLEAIKALGLTDDSHILDVGCGAGQTTRYLASQLSERGSVTGVDISEPLLAIAIKKNTYLNALYIQADVQHSQLREGFYSHAFSRFGVMFFDNSILAFRNINKSLREGARFCFSCWQMPEKNLWQTLVMREVKQCIDLPDEDMTNPGPFRFGDIDYLNSILTEAQFQSIQIEPLERDIVMFKQYSTEDAVNEMLELSPSLRFLQDYPIELQEQVKRASMKAYEEYQTKDGFVFPSAAWIVAAHKS